MKPGDGATINFSFQRNDVVNFVSLRACSVNLEDLIKIYP